MNYTLVIRLLGYICLAMCAAFISSMGVGFLYPESEDESQSIFGFVYSTIVTAGLGSVLVFLGRKAKNRIFKKEPTKEFYGIEALFKDDSGNWFSLGQKDKVPQS